MFFLFIFISLLILILGVYTCRIGIEVKNLKIDTNNPKEEIINKDSKIFVYISILKKVKILKINLNDVKLKNRKMDMKFLKNKDIKIDYGELIKNIDIEQIDLYAQIGTKDAAFTALLTGIVSALLGIILKKPKYQIIPIFSNKNFLKVRIDCIISAPLMQYIYKSMSKKIKGLGNLSLNKKVEV